MKRVVVVDDEPVLLNLWSSLLVEEGYAVQACQDARQCPDLVRQYRPDLLILDLHVPTVHHAETVIQAIRSDSAVAATPIILCTADTETVQRRRDWLRRYRIGYLPKPFDVDQALETVAQAIEAS
ncbi:MAG: response regulator [Chloroflexi bacterium]|nr:response regulator [Chloroflexota bacterium]